MAPSSKFDRSVGRRLQTTKSGWSSCLSWFSLADIRDHKFQQLTPTPKWPIQQHSEGESQAAACKVEGWGAHCGQRVRRRAQAGIAREMAARCPEDSCRPVRAPFGNK
jgi:hypothetical protein